MPSSSFYDSVENDLLTQPVSIRIAVYVFFHSIDLQPKIKAKQFHFCLTNKIQSESKSSPVENASDEGRDERDAGLGAGHRLAEAEQQRQVAADAVFRLQLAVNNAQFNIHVQVQFEIGSIPTSCFTERNAKYAIHVYLAVKHVSLWLSKLTRAHNGTIFTVSELLPTEEDKKKRNFYRAAWMPSQVEASLMRTRSLATPSSA